MKSNSKIKIIISAFSIYPYVKSSEGIVNKNWIDILIKKKSDLKIFTLYYSIFFSSNKVIKKLDRNLEKLYNASKNKKNILGFVYGFFNKLTIKLLRKNYSFLVLNWIKKTSKKLLKNIDKDTVVWSRILEVASLKTVLEAYKKNKFPYVVNINDPVLSKNKITFEEKVILQTKDTAQAWTFPSLELAKYFYNKYNLDKLRCFVIPHAMKKQDVLYKRNFKDKKIKVLYTGTFYKSAFTHQLKEALEDFNRSPISNNFEFTVILSQFNTESIQWLKETIKNVTILTKLNREEVLIHVKNSDCMLVVDAESHVKLLKGKLCEAISFGVPIFSASYKNSVMDKIVLSYGGFSAYQDVDNHIYKNLMKIEEKLNDKNWLEEFYIKRENVIEEMSEEEVYKKTIEVTRFAHNRFYNI